MTASPQVPPPAVGGTSEREALDRATVQAIARSRRHPRLTEFDGLHLRRLLADLTAALEAVGPVTDALDVYCGSRPYDDLIPATNLIGYDIDARYGVADVVGGDFLPFPDDSFDLITCIEGFFYVPDPHAGAAELERVLRPGGALVLTVPYVWEYGRAVLEHRFTASSLASVFADWEAVSVTESGGRGVVWATLTGYLILAAGGRLPRPLRWLTRPACALVNLIGGVVDRRERGIQHAEGVLPMNLVLVARKSAV